MKATPPPWKYDPIWGLVKHGREQICALHSGNEANARLITAAPELLEALCIALPFVEDALDDATYDRHKIQDRLTFIRAVIIKAIGEPK